MSRQQHSLHEPASFSYIRGKERIAVGACLQKLLVKSDEVLSLLARLPYIQHPRDWNSDAQSGPTCFFADWPDLIPMLTKDPSCIDYVRVRTEGDLGKPDVPYFIGLTSNRRDEALMVIWRRALAGVSRRDSEGV